MVFQNPIRGLSLNDRRRIIRTSQLQSALVIIITELRRLSHYGLGTCKYDTTSNRLVWSFRPEHYVDRISAHIVFSRCQRAESVQLPIAKAYGFLHPKIVDAGMEPTSALMYQNTEHSAQFVYGILQEKPA